MTKVVKIGFHIPASRCKASTNAKLHIGDMLSKHLAHTTRTRRHTYEFVASVERSQANRVQ